MSPEKVAVLLVTALITALLATALWNAEKAEASPRTPSLGGNPRPGAARRADPLDELTYDEIRAGALRPPPLERPADAAPRTEAAPPVEYLVKRGETLRVIARRELGGERFIPQIVELNPGLDPNKLAAGQKIKLPAKPKARATQRTSNDDGPRTPVKAANPGSARPAPPRTAEPKRPAKKGPTKSASPTVKPRAV